MPDTTPPLPPSSTDLPPGGGGSPDSGGGGNSGGNGGHIVDLLIERELQDSYLTYAMSTIMDRALPDVRDGLKPSQRRILVGMNDLNLRPGRKHMKCAKIVGDTMGNYHPHGDAALYGTLVNLAQRWRTRVPLVDPQGNFGSLDGDAPASMRYTEARMTHAALDLLDDVGPETVDFQPNYDDRLEEPTVLPGKFPNLLVNGGIGIAVGMATSLAPHNPIEVLDSIVRVLEKPEISLAELMEDEAEANGPGVPPVDKGAAQSDPGGVPGPLVTKARRLGIKGPDFPTAGIILGRRGIVDAYTSGRGKVTVRGTVHVEDMGVAGGRQQIVVDTIPFGLVQGTLMERIVDAVKDERIKDISDVRNESGREAQSRIVIELKRGADAAVVENQLYEFTPLQQTFSIHNIALVNRQPRTLSIKELIHHYIEHRAVVIRRRTEHQLREAQKRKHIVVGLVYAVCAIDEVIKIIRASKTRDQAIEALMARSYRIAAGSDVENLISRDVDLLAELKRAGAMGGAAGVTLTRVQAEAIGAMRLIQLVNMEVARLVDELLDLQTKIRDYNDILARRERIDAIIKYDCDDMRARLIASKQAPRLTRIEEADGDINIEALIQQDEVAVTISHHGYAKRSSLANYRQQGRGGKGIIAGTTKDDDFIEHMFVAGTHDDLLCFTDTGRVFKIKVYELPDLPRTSKGRPLVNLIDLKKYDEARRATEAEAGEGDESSAVGDGNRAGAKGGETAGAGSATGSRMETVRAFLAIKNFEQSSYYLTFASKQGIVKRTALKDYRNVSKAGLKAVGLKPGDEVLSVTLTTGNDDILLATALGQAIRFGEDDVRLMGRPAAGVKGIELADDDEVIGVVAIPMAPDADGDLMTAPESRNLQLLTITQKGYGKRTLVEEYRVQPEVGKARSQSRGGKGRVDIDASERNGRAVAALGVHDADDVVVISRNGKLVRMPVSEIRQTGRGTQGVRVTKLDEDDAVVAAARVEEEAVSPETGEANAG